MLHVTCLSFVFEFCVSTSPLSLSLFSLSLPSHLMSLKQQKQQFVSDLVGGSLSEIYRVAAVLVAGYFTNKLLSQLYRSNLVVDYLLNAQVALLSITLYSDDSTLYKIVLIPALILYILNPPKKSKPSPKVKDLDDTGLQPQLFITAYRSHMLIITNFAILAVDFHAFPRRFGKVETWGTSLMDMGVGSFVFSMGLVNSRTIIKQKLKGETNTITWSKYLQLLVDNSKKATPLLVLGVIRLLSVKGFDYQEHVTEYGIHWNFFITLGLLPVFMALLDPILELIAPRALIALIIILAYEYLLVKRDGLKYVLTSENRLDNVITMNKEGVFSFAGYLSIFLFGQSFGSFVFLNKKTPNNLIMFNLRTRNPKSWLSVTTIQGLLISTIVYQLVFYWVNQSPMFFGVSRRLCNLPYVAMVVAYNSFFLLLYKLVDCLLGNNGTNSVVLEAINKNGLTCFLLGNLLTGLINLTTNTLLYDNKMSCMILLVYGVVFVGIAVLLGKFNIYIKL